MAASVLARLHDFTAFSSVIQSSLVSAGTTGETDRFFVTHISVMVSFLGVAVIADLNWTITAVILSQPVPSPRVSGARQ